VCALFRVLKTLLLNKNSAENGVKPHGSVSAVTGMCVAGPAIAGGQRSMAETAIRPTSAPSRTTGTASPNLYTRRAAIAVGVWLAEDFNLGLAEVDYPVDLPIQ
jgi:hypothetical protein